MADSEPQKSAEATRIPALEDSPIAYRLVISGGAASFMLGLSVLIGWHAHLPTLIQVSPAFVPMQYNTALAFLLSGLGLLCLTGNRAWVARACGILVMLVGTATLAEYALAIDLGIDELLMESYITVKTSHAGRMAPNTALCFALMGGALVVISTKERVWRPGMIVGILGSLILGLALVALAGYAIRFEATYGWANLTRMAVHTAAGFVFLGAAVTRIGWSYDVSDRSRVPSWLPLPIGFGVVTIIIGFWYALDLQEARLADLYGTAEHLLWASDALLIVGILLAGSAAYLARAAQIRARILMNTNEMLATEIDERRRAEQINKELEMQLRHKQKLESIGTLAGGVAHEINNPITGIMNFAQLIEERIDPQSPLREFAREIGLESKRIATIVRNLLAFARQEMEAHSRAEIADIVEDTLSLVRTVIARDQIALSVDLPGDLPRIKCRSQQIQQVLMNLLTNARDALNERYPGHDPDKVMSLTVRLFEKQGRHWIRLTVADHGSGVSDEIQERLFDPFFTTKDRTKGTGLGLSISSGIIDDHKGELYFESEPNGTTCFHLELPVDTGWSPPAALESERSDC